MNTLGWVFILVAFLMMRAVARGRVMHIGEDLADGFLAMARGDTDALGEVLTRKGEATEPTSADLAVSNLTAGVVAGMSNATISIGEGIGQAFDFQGAANDVGLAAVLLGNKARGYRWTATGPEYYDCSGLMWRACQVAGVYKGPRFTTHSFAAMTGMPRVSKPQSGDIVVWPAKHMGVVSGPDRFYSARNPRAGIGETSISGFRKDTPKYYRPNKRGKGFNPFAGKPNDPFKNGLR